MISYLKNGDNGGLVTVNEWSPKCWINITAPTPEEVDFILNKLEVPSDFLYDIQDDDERPRVEVEAGWTLIIMRLPIRHNAAVPFSTVPLGIVMKDDIISTICFHENVVIPDFILHTQRKSIYIDNNLNFLLRLFLSASVWFQKYLKQIYINIQIAEKELEKSIKNEELQTLLKIQKSLTYFITSLKSNSILISKIKNIKDGESIFDEALLEDVEIELKQAIETTKVHSDILANTLDAYASIISNNVNDIMKHLTSITVVVMIPSLIATIYGMNVINYLEDSPYGFLIVMIVSIIATFLGIVYLRRRTLF